jgi:thioredoxin 1
MQSVATRAELDPALAGRKVVALFHATWCPFCRAFRPQFGELAGLAAGYAPLEVLMDDEDGPLWDAYQVTAVPTVLFFDDGRVTSRLDARPGIGLTEALFREAVAKVG